MYVLMAQREPHALTFCLRADQAGRGVAERAQDGSYGQAQVLVARVQSNRGKAQIRQAGSFLRTDFYMRDLQERGFRQEKKTIRKTRKKSNMW